MSRILIRAPMQRQPMPGLLDRGADRDRHLRADLRRDRDRQALTAPAGRDAPPQPDYGPSLPQLLRPRLRALRRAGSGSLLGLVVLALVAGVAALVISRRRRSRPTCRPRPTPARAACAPLAFHFDHSSKLKLSKPAGAYVQAERTKDGRAGRRASPSRRSSSSRQPGLARRLPADHRDRPRARRRAPVRALPAPVRGPRAGERGRGLPVRVHGAAAASRAGRRASCSVGSWCCPSPTTTRTRTSSTRPAQTPTRGVLITMLATTLDDAPSRRPGSATRASCSARSAASASATG